MAGQFSGNLPPIVIPPGPLVPAWAVEAVNRIGLMTGAVLKILPASSVVGNVGENLFTFSSGNAIVAIYLPKLALSASAADLIENSQSNTTGGISIVTLAKITGGGVNGSATFINGIFQHNAYISPT